MKTLVFLHPLSLKSSRLWDELGTMGQLLCQEKQQFILIEIQLLIKPYISPFQQNDSKRSILYSRLYKGY